MAACSAFGMLIDVVLARSYPSHAAIFYLCGYGYVCMYVCIIASEKLEEGILYIQDQNQN